MRLLSIRTERLDADALRDTIMRIAKEKDLDSMVVVEALAQVLGLVAAQMDMRGIGVPCTIEERLDTLGVRVKELHQHWLARMKSMPLVGSGR